MQEEIRVINGLMPTFIPSNRKGDLNLLMSSLLETNDELQFAGEGKNKNGMLLGFLEYIT